MSVETKSYGRQYQALWPELEASLRRCFLEDDPILGNAVSRFELALAKYHDVRFAVGVGSGSDALALTLSELGIGSGDEVVTCAHTFPGVLVTLLRVGIKPVLVDAEPTTMLMDVGAARAAIGPRTRAILAVHMYGHAIDMRELTQIARERGVHLIEDVAQAHGARCGARKLGGFGRAGILSFHPSKNLGAFGDGGAVLTNDQGLARHLRVSRNLGKVGKYEFATLGINSKLDTIQATVLEIKLGYLDGWNARRRQLAALYRSGLSNLPRFTLPSEAPFAHDVYHLYVVRTPARDALRAYMAQRGVKSGLHYPTAAHRQPALIGHFEGSTFPNAERIAADCLTLPLSHEHTDAEIREVIAAVRGFHGQ